MDNYLIEIRLFGKSKTEACDLVQEVSQRYHIPVKKTPPHITLIGQFTTNNEAKLLNDFESVCRRYGLARYVIKGIGTFPDAGVVFLDVQASQELTNFRRELRDKIKGYCDLPEYDFDEPFEFHASIALHLTKEQTKKIKNNMTRPNKYRHRMLRVTLIKKGKILREYDFALQRNLTRNEALSDTILTETFKTCTTEPIKRCTTESIIQIENKVSWWKKLLSKLGLCNSR